MSTLYYCPICGEVTSCPHYDQTRKPKQYKPNKKYDGMHCPYCNSTRIEAMKQVEMDGTSGSQLIECKDCNKGWYDILKVVGWEALE
jgi:transcription elongation factor Elf1